MSECSVCGEPLATIGEMFSEDDRCDTCFALKPASSPTTNGFNYQPRALVTDEELEEVLDIFR